MKKLIYALLLLVTNFSFAQVASYPFNGDANDHSGNNNNPISNNATLTFDRNGNPNSAYHFNGTSSFMQIPNSASLQLGNQMSIAVWVRPTGYNTNPCYGNVMITKSSTATAASNFYLRFADVYNGCGNNPGTTQERFTGNNAIAATPFVQLNQWYSVVWTSDGTTERIYVDCVLRDSKPVGGTAFTNTFPMFFGRQNDPNYLYWFNGDLDDIRIYNNVLTQAQINAYGGCTVPCNAPNTYTTVQKCTDQNITLNARNGSNYLWAPATFLNSTTIQNPICSANANISYTVRVLSADSTCFNNDTINVVVNNCHCEDSCNWSLTGNTNVKAGYFIGSLNNADFKIRTNNTQRMVVSAAGNVGINTLTPVKLFEVNGEARISTLPASAANDKIVFANTSGDLHSLPTTGNQNQYLSGDGTWQNITGGGGITNADQGLTLNGNTVVLGDVCNAGGGQFADNREINMNNQNLYFNSLKNGKLYMGITQNKGDIGCKDLYTRLEISSVGLRAQNEYTSPNPSTSGLRFTDLTAVNTEPIDNKYNGVLSLDEDGDVIWVKACCKDGTIEPRLNEILSRLAKLENEVKESKAQAALLKDQLVQMDVLLSKTNTVVLNQNVPNPFSESTVITYSIPKAFGKAQIIFSTITGEVIKIADIKSSGKGQVNVFANDISSGIYTYTLVIDGKQIETKKMIKQ